MIFFFQNLFLRVRNRRCINIIIHYPILAKDLGICQFRRADKPLGFPHRDRYCSRCFFHQCIVAHYECSASSPRFWRYLKRFRQSCTSVDVPLRIYVIEKSMTDP